MISAIVLTFNEENILGKCLDALNFADELVVFDSFSTDETVSIAKKKGAQIFQRTFDNYSNQRNEALKKISKDARWVLMVDADEIVSDSLKKEILEAVKNEDVSMYRVRRMDFFQGKWLKYSSGYPTWFPRLFKNGDVEVQREINEEYFTKGKIAHLDEHLLHYPFNKGLTHWFNKHNIYSEMEAKLMLNEINEKNSFLNLINSSPVVRRKAQKRLSYKLPFRPYFVFLAFFVFKRGFLDGKAGFQFCKMRKIYETMIELKFNVLISANES